MRRSGERPFPKGVRTQRYRLRSTGEIVRYAYYGRGREAQPLGRVGSQEFYEALAAIAKPPPPADDVRGLISRYQASIEFKKLSPRTQRDYRTLLSKIAEHFGPLTLEAMSQREMARHIHDWRDGLSAAPRRADYAVQVLKVILAWGVRRGLLDTNRAAHVPRLYKSDRRASTWTDAQVAAFCGSAPQPLVRALILAIETGQRQADLLSLSWSGVRGNVIELVQAKTGQPVAVPIGAELRALLEETPKSALRILTKGDGKPWDEKGNGFRSAWRDACRKAGVTGVTFHDLRGTFVTRKLAAGWTPLEVAICTGHSLRDLKMLDVYADRVRVAEATASRLAERLAQNDERTTLSK